MVTANWHVYSWRCWKPLVPAWCALGARADGLRQSAMVLGLMIVNGESLVFNGESSGYA